VADNLFVTVQALGGPGRFLSSMIIMTGALRKMAGDAIRPALMRFSSSTTSGAVTGDISTAILQSSSATTVAAVGFIGAGLRTFTSSLGIIFDANIGTTITGWLVAPVGFKLRPGIRNRRYQGKNHAV
jgi:phosphate:Na+ symporter